MWRLIGRIIARVTGQACIHTSKGKNRLANPSLPSLFDPKKQHRVHVLPGPFTVMSRAWFTHSPHPSIVKSLPATFTMVPRTEQEQTKDKAKVTYFVTITNSKVISTLGRIDCISPVVTNSNYYNKQQQRGQWVKATLAEKSSGTDDPFTTYRCIPNVSANATPDKNPPAYAEKR